MVTFQSGQWAPGTGHGCISQKNSPRCGLLARHGAEAECVGLCLSFFFFIPDNVPPPALNRLSFCTLLSGPSVTAVRDVG